MAIIYTTKNIANIEHLTAPEAMEITLRIDFLRNSSKGVCVDTFFS
jgi:hypothetical protein